MSEAGGSRCNSPDVDLIIKPDTIKERNDVLSDAGMKYLYAVTALCASKLSTHENVSDYRIYSCEDSYGIFDDIVTNIRLKSSNDVYTSMIQVKYKATQDLDINKIFKGKDLDDIKNYTEKLEDSKVRFGIFSNTNICKVKKLFRGNVKYQFSSSPLDKTDDITEILLPCSGSKSKFVCKPAMDAQYDCLFSNCYLCLNQPGIQDIKQELKKICDVDDPDAIITYVSNYFSVQPLRKQGMTKHIFETELQKIRFSRFIISTQMIREFDKHDWISAWNDVMLTQDVTIINNSDRDIDIEGNLLGYLIQKLNSLLGININEKTFVQQDLRKELHEKFKTYSETHTYRYYVPLPDKIESLLIELWKIGVLPMILKCEDQNNFEKYIQPGCKYIIIADSSRRTPSIPENLGLNIFRHMGDIADVDKRNKLLENVRVSLQGRQPTTLRHLTDGNEELIKTFWTTDIIKLMKPRSLYLKQSCLEDCNNLAFFIEDQNYTSDPVIKTQHEIGGDNIEISCHPDKIKEEIKIFENKSEYADYTICHLERIHDRLKLIQGDHSRLRSYFIDQYGQPLYSTNEGELIPIIGDTNYFTEGNYLPRYLRKSTIDMSYFNSEETQICLVSGDVNTIVFNKIDVEDDKLELEQKKAYFVKVKEEERQYYWDKLSSLKYPIFDVAIRGSKAELLRYKSCGNLRQYIEYNGDTISEEQFFEDFKKTKGVTVLTGEPGMGKSSLIKSLYGNTDKYILSYDLMEYRHHKDRPIRFDNLRSKIFEKRKSKDHNDFLQQLCNQNRLIVSLDSYNEITSTEDIETSALKLIENIAVRGIPIVICSRSVLSKSTDVCTIQTLKLEALDLNVPAGYFKNWGLTDLLDIPPEFIRNPLYSKFFKIFSKNQSNFNGFNRFKLYEAVVNWIIQRSLAATNPYFESGDIEGMRRFFERLAPIRFFGEDKNASRCLLDRLRPKHIRTGIITGFDGNIPVFIHSTFLEYFVFKWVIRALKEERRKKSAISRYKQLLTEKHVHILEIEFDQSSLQRAIIEARISTVEEFLRNNRECLDSLDKLERTVLHIAAIRCRYGSYWNSSNYIILEKIIQAMQDYNLDYIRKPDLSGMTWADCVNAEILQNLILNNLFTSVEMYLEMEMENVERTNNSNVFPIDERCFERLFKVVNRRCLSNNIIRNLLFLQNYNNEEVRKFLQDCIIEKPGDELSWTEEICGSLTPMHVACIYCSLPLVQRFIETECDINVTDRNGCTPLYYSVMQCSLQERACTADNLSITRLLLSNEADITQPDNGCGTILYTGVRSRNIDIVKMILEHASSKNFQQMTTDEYINMKNRDSTSPLHLAIKNGDVDIVKLLLNEGANPNLVDRYGEMSLHGAVNVGNLDMIQALLEGGADINTRNICNRTPLQFSAEKGNIEVLKMLLEQKQIDNQNDCIDAACFSAVLEGNENIINLLLDRITNINVKGKNCDTLLHTAILTGKVNIAHLLIKRGANIDAKNRWGNTPLYCAVEIENQDMAKLLLQQGVNPNIGNANGNTSLHLAADKGNVQIAQLLLKYKADMEVKNKSEDTPFLFSLRQRKLMKIMMKLLTGQIKDWSLEQENAESVLREAVSVGNTDAIGILLDKGLDINVKFVNDDTILHLAVCLGNLDVIKLLVEKGADVNSKNEKGQTPIDIAVSSKNDDVAMMLRRLAT